MQREVAERLPDRLVRRHPRAQQALELVGGGDLGDAERAECIGAQGGGRAVRVVGATSVRGPARPGRLRWFDGVGLPRSPPPRRRAGHRAARREARTPAPARWRTGSAGRRRRVGRRPTPHRAVRSTGGGGQGVQDGGELLGGVLPDLRAFGHRQGAVDVLSDLGPAPPSGRAAMRPARSSRGRPVGCRPRARSRGLDGVGEEAAAGCRSTVAGCARDRPTRAVISWIGPAPGSRT